VCGACGRTTLPDPALDVVRTLRQHLIVAATVNRLCKGLPGAPKVTALKDGWLITGPSGTARLRHTLDELWTAAVGCFADMSILGCLLGRLQAFTLDPDNAGLPARVADIGRGLTVAAVGEAIGARARRR
jgi:hypothetical protein